MWQDCNDPNVRSISFEVENHALDEKVEPEEHLAKEVTSWGPSDMNDGLWEVNLNFYNHQGTQFNSDGIGSWLTKLSRAHYFFFVGITPDLTNDCFVNFGDFAIFSERWEHVGCGEFNNWCNGADLDKSETVGWGDVNVLAEKWLRDLAFEL